MTLKKRKRELKEELKQVRKQITYLENLPPRKRRREDGKESPKEREIAAKESDTAPEKGGLQEKESSMIKKLQPRNVLPL